MILAGCVIGYLLAGGAARYVWGPSINNLIVTAVLATGLPLVLLILLRPQTATSSRQKNPRAELAEALLHSTSPMVLATGIDGSFNYLNPSAERILGLRASEMIGRAQMTEIFAPGELERIQSVAAQTASQHCQRSGCRSRSDEGLHQLCSAVSTKPVARH